MTPAEETFAAARSATTDDLAQLERLEQLGAELVAPQRGGELFLLHDARGATLEGALGDRATLVLVGSIDDVTVGFAVATLTELRGGPPMAVVSDLFVEPDARQVGVGEALMQSVLQWAADQGCRGVDATALPGDRLTKNFFESFGLVARAISVHRAIEP